MVKHYIPERGDIVLIYFNPAAGHEQTGQRPAVVLSPRMYNEKTGLAVFCPITSQIKQYPFEVVLPQKIRTRGVVLSDHVKSLDWQARKARFREKLPHAYLREVMEKLALLVG